MPVTVMVSDSSHNSTLVWCPLIPLDDLSELVGHENELEKINEVYDDWRSSMRGRPTVVDDVGIFLDRIRMLWISVGIACGAERALAEKVQAIIGSHLRKAAITLVSRMPAKNFNQAAVKQTLANFFQQLRFGHDVFPLEEIQKTAVSPHQMKKSSDPPSRRKTKATSKRSKNLENIEKDLADDGVVNVALDESVKILSVLFDHLLSPDPWGVE
ncbi:MAG: hypothetical protein C4K47_02620 [Candidatus Thorarchaeota archaeon]|nr:MAG: hypothetical protein C4K47_02620 [Candidatus Thorarchaeota archaeon]